MEDQIHCPKCGSTQITANKKGFSGGKAVAGTVLTGGIGLLAGTIGSKKIMITCLNCGKQFKPGEGNKSIAAKPKWTTFQDVKSDVDFAKRRKTNKRAARVFGPLFIIISIILFVSDAYLIAAVFGFFGLIALLMAVGKGLE